MAVENQEIRISYRLSRFLGLQKRIFVTLCHRMALVIWKALFGKQRSRIISLP